MVIKYNCGVSSMCSIYRKWSFLETQAKNRFLWRNGNVFLENFPAQQQQWCNHLVFTFRNTELQWVPKAGLCDSQNRKKVYNPKMETKCNSKKWKKSNIFLLIEPKIIVSHSVQFTVYLRSALILTLSDPIHSSSLKRSPLTCSGQTLVKIFYKLKALDDSTYFPPSALNLNHSLQPY